jgi:hypothetical protein
MPKVHPPSRDEGSEREPSRCLSWVAVDRASDEEATVNRIEIEFRQAHESGTLRSAVEHYSKEPSEVLVRNPSLADRARLVKDFTTAREFTLWSDGFDLDGWKKDLSKPPILVKPGEQPKLTPLEQRSAHLLEALYRLLDCEGRGGGEASAASSHRTDLWEEFWQHSMELLRQRVLEYLRVRGNLRVAVEAQRGRPFIEGSKKTRSDALGKLAEETYRALQSRGAPPTAREVWNKLPEIDVKRRVVPDVFHARDCLNWCRTPESRSDPEEISFEAFRRRFSRLQRKMKSLH